MEDFMNPTQIKTKHKHYTNYTYPYALQEYSDFKNYEKKYNYRLKNNVYYIIRFDGKEMTKDYKIKKQAINVPFFNTMKETFLQFCSHKPNIIFAYSFSDEISILIRGDENEDSDHLRIEKILSLYASELSLKFYVNAKKFNLKLKQDSLFDARIIEIEDEMILKYFTARQAFAIIKYLSRLKTQYQINQQFKSSKVIISELRNKNIYYNQLPKEYRYGFYYSAKDKIIDSFEFKRNIKRLKELMISIKKEESSI